MFLCVCEHELLQNRAVGGEEEVLVVYGVRVVMLVDLRQDVDVQLHPVLGELASLLLLDLETKRFRADIPQRGSFHRPSVIGKYGLLCLAHKEQLVCPTCRAP